tara:strand:- start:1026 stop:1814 length:789 start_codon:yes stop_codon:yes gene_type:complete
MTELKITKQPEQTLQRRWLHRNLKQHTLAMAKPTACIVTVHHYLQWLKDSPFDFNQGESPIDEYAWSMQDFQPSDIEKIYLYDNWILTHRISKKYQEDWCLSYGSPDLHGLEDRIMKIHDLYINSNDRFILQQLVIGLHIMRLRFDADAPCIKIREKAIIDRAYGRESVESTYLVPIRTKHINKWFDELEIPETERDQTLLGWFDDYVNSLNVFSDLHYEFEKIEDYIINVGLSCSDDLRELEHKYMQNIGVRLLKFITRHK